MLPHNDASKHSFNVPSYCALKPFPSPLLDLNSNHKRLSVEIRVAGGDDPQYRPVNK
jgi:hypothetical protein